jgi:hypothetical protein
MPVAETITLIDRLEPETGVAPSLVIANRVLPLLYDVDERDLVHRLDDAHDVLVGAAGKGAGAVVRAAQINDARHRTGEGHLDRLRDAIGELSMVAVPEMFTRATGARVVALVADALDETIDLGAA